MRPAELHSAELEATVRPSVESEAAERMSAGRTGHRPVLRARSGIPRVRAGLAFRSG